MTDYLVPITDGLDASKVVITDANKKLASQSGLTDSKAVITAVSLALTQGPLRNDGYDIFTDNSNLAANWIGCLFTTSGAVTACGVVLPFTMGSGTVTASIRATSSNLPTGGDLGSGTYTGASPGVQYGMGFIPFSAPISLSASTQYAIILRISANVVLRWGGRCDFPYTALVSTNSGSTWTNTGDKLLRYTLICGTLSSTSSTLTFTKGVLTGVA